MFLDQIKCQLVVIGSPFMFIIFNSPLFNSFLMPISGIIEEPKPAIIACFTASLDVNSICLLNTMPLFSIALFIYILANMSIPGSSSFIGELLILAGIFEDNTTTAIYSTVGMFLGGIYSLLFYNKIC